MPSYCIVLIFCCVTNGDDHVEAGSIASQYRIIIEDVRKQIKENKTADTGIASIISKNSDRLRLLAQGAMLERSASYSTEDCISLSECWSRLNDEERSVDWARVAVDRKASIVTYTTLVRALCATGRTVEAEWTITLAVEKCGEEQDFYVLHNLIALQYLREHQYLLARKHLEETTNYVVNLCDIDSFYGHHLSRCLNQLYMCDEGGSGRWLEVKCNQWRVSIEARLDMEMRKYFAQNAERQQSVKKIRALSISLIALNSFLSRDEGENVLVKWVDVLLDGKDVGSGDVWNNEVSLLATECVRSIGPTWDGKALCRKVADLMKLLDEDAVRGNRVHSVQRRVSEVHELLLRHVECRKTVGKTLFQGLKREEEWTAGCDFTLVHIVDPRSPHFSEGIRAVMLRERDMAKAPRVGIKFMAIDIRDATEVQTESAEISQHKRLDDVKAALSAPDELELMKAADIARLGVSSLPSIVVVDASGSILCAVGTANSAVVSRLVRWARSKRE